MKRSWEHLWPRAISGLILLAYLEAVRLAAGAPFQSGGMLIRWLLVQATLEAALWVGGVQSCRGSMILTWRVVILLVVLIGSAVVYGLAAYTLAAWVANMAFYALIAAFSPVCSGPPWAAPALTWTLCAFAGGIVPVVAGQLESRFAEEEFFVALQAIALGIFAGLLILSYSWVARSSQHEDPASTQGQQRFRVPSWGMFGVLLVVGLLVVGLAVWGYQHGFFSTQVPTYPGVSRDEPFVCGPSIPHSEKPDGEDTFRRLLARVATNPESAAPEYGMLALATGESRWAEAFRQSILRDAQDERFTEPSNSVKSGQYHASRRVYYLPRVQEAFPDLFSKEEADLIRDWLLAVNQRALTVEWVDWLYALAFSYWPRGPYENQENGAGLIALLEASNLADSSLSGYNQEYLANNQRGWFERFRNTDDAYLYQAEWIDNAFFQFEYWAGEGNASEEASRNQRLAFEWLLLQALPDGATLRYNHPMPVSVAQTAYLGASVLNDPRYVWWAARILGWLEQVDVPLYAQPGVEQAVSFDGVSPDISSCLLFGDSGLPTQQGPLAPDKIVFRDGWTSTSRYLLLNLRFTGWHRYKATNSVTLLYHGEPLVLEQSQGRPFDWLPVGRSLFRDKRVPRENLNGLLVPRTGVSAVLYELTGFGGPWAQDPPHYANVIEFSTSEVMDSSHTVLDDWRGWRHDRRVLFYHSGPIVVMDHVSGPRGSKPALGWYLSGTAQVQGDRIRLQERLYPAEIVLLSVGEPGTTDVESVEDATHLLHHFRGGESEVATVFLTGDWLGSQVKVQRSPTGQATVLVISGENQIEIPCFGALE